MTDRTTFQRAMRGDRVAQKEIVAGVARRFKVTVEPDYHGLAGHRRRLFDEESIGLVIDVGANAGQYGGWLRSGGYRGRIESFEPNPEVVVDLRRNADADGNWGVHPCALGRTAGVADFFVTDQSQSSSLLAPSTDEFAFMHGEWSDPVEVRTLDDFRFWEQQRPLFLKLDIQGFEVEALEGAHETLQHVRGVECELSLVAIYEDQALIEDVIALLRDHGFTPRALVRGFTTPDTHDVVQVDGIFGRPR